MNEIEQKGIPNSNEKEDINDIAKQTYENSETHSGILVFRIGNTTLELSEKSLAFTSELRRSGEKENPDKSITTTIFIAAKMEMQRRVNESGKSKKYLFSTINPRLALWANTKGREIFYWTNRGPLNKEYLDVIEKTNEKEDGILEQQIVFSTVIKPE